MLSDTELLPVVLAWTVPRAVSTSRASCGAFEKLSSAERVPEPLATSYDRDWIFLSRDPERHCGC